MQYLIFKKKKSIFKAFGVLEKCSEYFIGYATQVRNSKTENCSRRERVESSVSRAFPTAAAVGGSSKRLEPHIETVRPPAQIRTQIYPRF